MGLPASVVALSSVLAACKSAPRMEGRRLILWRDVRRILDKYGISYKFYTCRFEYGRRARGGAKKRLPAARVEGAREIVEYTRVKVVVTDYSIAKRAVELLRDSNRARVVFSRYSNIVKDVLLSLRSISVTVKKYIPKTTLRRIFGLYKKYGYLARKPPYARFLGRSIVRLIMPNWRGSRFKWFMQSPLLRELIERRRF